MLARRETQNAEPNCL